MKIRKRIFSIYILNLTLWLVFVIIKFFDVNFFEIILTVFTSIQGLVFLHVTFIVVVLLYFFFVKCYKVQRENGSRQLLIMFLKTTILPLFSMGTILYMINVVNNSESFKIINSTNFNYNEVSNDYYQQDLKIRGASVFGLNSDSKDEISTIIQNNIEWIALHPFIYQDEENDIKIKSKKDNFSKKDSAYVRTINQLHSKKLHIMLKPHLWVSNGWRNNINFKYSEKWNTWFKSYSKIILFYAKLAQETNVELFCIGTELDKTLIHHSKDWLVLIEEVRNVYEGKLTYAMNWDTDFFNPEFWSELDYIGIQAYYPLTQNKEPNLLEIKKGWESQTTKLKAVSNQINKPVLFTEIGYRNDIYATIKPWEWSNIIKRFFRKKSNRTQYFAFKAFFDEVWSEPWFSGVFFWQWNEGSDFSMLNKPAQNLVMSEFSKTH